MGRPWELAVHALGWTLRLDAYGASLFDVHRHQVDAEAAEHDCRRDHPDGPCDDEVMGFRDDDLESLLWRARHGDDPTELMAEFHAGIRADPERPA